VAWQALPPWHWTSQKATVAEQKTTMQQKTTMEQKVTVMKL
jgi:hypothetical protein